MEFPSWNEFMKPTEESPAKSMLIQALAMLSGSERFKDKTPYEIYDMVVDQTIEVTAATPS